MDEPLAALDCGARRRSCPISSGCSAELAIPILYVSHDIAEVERLADRIVVIEKGRVRAAGALNAALTDSGLGFVRDPHAAAVLPARVVAYHAEDALTELDLGGQPVFVDGSGPHDVGAARRLRIEARDVSLSRESRRCRPSPTRSRSASLRSSRRMPPIIRSSWPWRGPNSSASSPRSPAARRTACRWRPGTASSRRSSRSRWPPPGRSATDAAPAERTSENHRPDLGWGPEPEVVPE